MRVRDSRFGRGVTEPAAKQRDTGMIRIIPILALATMLLTACSERAAPANGATPDAADAPQSADQEIYEDDANIDVWLERLEVNSRELYSARDAVVMAIGLKEGAASVV